MSCSQKFILKVSFSCQGNMSYKANYFNIRYSITLKIRIQNLEKEVLVNISLKSLQ